MSTGLHSIPTGPLDRGRGDDWMWEASGLRWVVRATWLFVGIGVLLRVARYLMNFPLWCDEAFVAANLIDRSYSDLLRPLDYLQVCPILFLWIERSFMTLLGFSERSLRLFPMICGVASVPLFWYAASRLVRGTPLLLAVGIFAISSHPIRHAAEVKPYASDLLMALVLLALALEWLRSPERVGRLWALAATVPVALALSLPAIFVAGGVSIGLIVPVWRTHRWRARLPFVVFNVAAVGTFAGLFVICTGVQDPVTMRTLRVLWAPSFPPLDDFVKLVRWLFKVHTGPLFAYPGLGRGSAGTWTLLLFGVGVVALSRRRQTAVLVTCLAPFALAIVAAALRRYPYGAEARLTQFVVPSICLLAGIGAANLVSAIRWPRVRAGVLGGGLLLGVAFALLMVSHDVARPYRFVDDQRAREFARRFWSDRARGAEVACFRWDFESRQRWRHVYWTATYFCNQWIYSPQRRLGGPRWDLVSASRPLRCVLYDPSVSDAPAVSSWLTSMSSRYDLQRSETLEFELASLGKKSGTAVIQIFEFVPRTSPSEPADIPLADPQWAPLRESPL